MTAGERLDRSTEEVEFGIRRDSRAHHGEQEQYWPARRKFGGEGHFSEDPCFLKEFKQKQLSHSRQARHRCELARARV